MNDLPGRLRDALLDLDPARPESVETLRDLYDETVEFRDPIQTLYGVDAFLAMNRRLLGRVRSLSFDVSSAVGTDDEAYLEWTMHGRPKVGPRVQVQGVTHARARDGKVVYHRDFWDLGELAASAVPGGRSALRLLLKPLA
jgi:hypothetical protein